MEQNLNEAERLGNEARGKLAKVEKDLEEAEQMKQAALMEAESARQALAQALQLADRYRVGADQLANEMRESKQLSRESLEKAKQEAESSRAALVEVERRVGDEREARERAERELRKRNDEIVPHTLFGYRLVSSPKLPLMTVHESTTSIACSLPSFF
ncbi:hypothetical protein BT96DRAFT_517980 [Gymnopus androsaceus JB14]|uniref:Uncharacterized protein n=1 Tax=Gymnopus androsaceus JB14 TaxID=1447944 RepID=A0A6A4HXL1_9AGAR|nr:hypothetical protein BT96DRAFT_517980 [Gymnopus androsaceus JB14]